MAGASKKQLEHAESHALGREEFYFEPGPKGSFRGGVRRADAATKPPLNPMHRLPVGRGRGTCKPGE